MFNRYKLRGKMAERNCTNEKLAKVIGIDSATLYRKTNGKSEFTRSEIQQITTYLKLSMEEVQNIFFADELA